MNKEEVLRNRKVWTDALRSGKYKQGMLKLCTAGLDNDYYHCCLGVAFEVAPEFGVEVLRIEEQNGVVPFNDSITTLTPEMMGLLGLSIEDVRELIKKMTLGNLLRRLLTISRLCQ